MNDESLALLTRHGFAMVASSSKLVKEFHIGKRVISIVPFFGKNGNITSVRVEDTKRRRKVTFSDGTDLAEKLAKLPVICLGPLVDIIADVFGINIISRDQKYIVTEQCILCGTVSHSFITTKMGAICSVCFKV